MSLKEKLREFIHQPGDPPKLAFAFAVGLLLGVLPGTGAIVAAGVAAVLRLNIPLAVAGALFINPVTAPFVYGGSYFLGRWVLGNEALEHTLRRVLLTTATGNLIMAVMMAVLGYLAVWALALWCKARKEK